MLKESQKDPAEVVTLTAFQGGNLSTSFWTIYLPAKFHLTIASDATPVDPKWVIFGKEQIPVHFPSTFPDVRQT